MEIFTQFNWWSVLDILLIAAIVYQVLVLIRGTRTAQMLTGILVVILAFQASSFVPLTTFNWLMSKFYSSIVLIIIILFQDDIRNALSRIGKKSILSSTEAIVSHYVLDELTRAAFALASRKIGALLVIERNIILSRYVEIGIPLDSKMSKEIILSIFNTYSPIHDGAVIIRQGRIAAAGCFLPLTREENLKPEMGTRHRAAIGISQETDAIVILVSEEKGTVSLVIEGKVAVAPDPAQLRKSLRKQLIGKPQYVKSVLVSEGPTPKAKEKGS
ncbi:MAG: TIGR00159 family protein [Deltaproteobacteria bacterium]|nr:TIGR00159 family protein [Deltaproteobacteria bacterium]